MQRGNNSGLTISLSVVIVSVFIVAVISYGISEKFIFSNRITGKVIGGPSCPDGFSYNPLDGTCTYCEEILYETQCYVCQQGQNPKVINGVCMYCANGTWSGNECITNSGGNQSNITYSWCDSWMINWSSNSSTRNDPSYNLTSWCKNCTSWTNVNLSDQTINRSYYTWNNLCSLPSTNQSNQTGNWCKDWLNNWTISKTSNNSNEVYNLSSWCSSCKTYTGGNWSNFTGSNIFYNWARLCSTVSQSCSNGIMVNGSCLCINGIWYQGQCFCPNGQIINNVCYRGATNQSNNTNNNGTNNSGFFGTEQKVEPGSTCRIKESYWSEGSSVLSEGESVTLTIVGEKGCTNGNKISIKIYDEDFLMDDLIYSTEISLDKRDSDIVYTQISFTLSEEKLPNLLSAYDSIGEGDYVELKAKTSVKSPDITTLPISQRSKQQNLRGQEVDSDTIDFSYFVSQNSQEEP